LRTITISTFVFFLCAIAFAQSQKVTLPNAFTVAGSTPPPTGALLTGCVVNETNNTPSCPIPTGWQRVVAEGFGGGKLNNPNTQTVVTTGGISTANPHTGSYSLAGLYQSADDIVNWILNQGTTGTFKSLDLSFWDYVDSNAEFGTSDYYWNDFGINGVCGQVQDFGYDAQNYVSNVASPNSNMQGVSNGSTSAFPACQGYYQQQAPQISMNRGTWRQYEILYTPSTTVSQGSAGQCPGLPENMNPYCVGNGNTVVYLNGQTFISTPNANLNGTTSMTNAYVSVGGVITVFCSDGSYAQPFSKCSGTPTPFHRYIDDIILIKQ